MASGRKYEHPKQETGRQDQFQEDQQIYRIPPFFYLHVLDQNTNVTCIEVGPKTYIRQDNERVVFGPEKMITVPPRHYCVVENPVFKNDNNEIVFDEHGQAKLLHADQDIRLSQDPFPLYPGEVLKVPVTELKIVRANTALKLRAVLDVAEPTKRVAGDEWLFEGPGTYIPRKEEVVEEIVKASVIKPNQALRLRARKEFVDRAGKQRVTGEEWLVKKIGAYLLGAYEEVVATVDAYVLTEKKALHVTSLRTFKDDFGIVRKSGEEWLITMDMTETHIPSVYENVRGVVKITTLTNRQYCVILDPIDDHGKPQLGRKKLVKGEKSFFLMPGESLERGIQDVYVLGQDEGLLLKSTETFRDADADVGRNPGDRWMLLGPAEYVPPVEVEVICRRHALALRQTEGIYIRNIKTGKVKSVSGVRYMLNEDEELWEKALPPVVEKLIVEGKDPLAQRSIHEESPPLKIKRDKTRLVTFRVPHNAAVQIYDFKDKQSRVIFGPELVMLAPDEQFTQLSLSGGKPKKPNIIKSLCLLLGPDFCTDIIVVETADHARLQLQLAYNWHFDVNSMKCSKDAASLFSVPDFVGDACKAIASRIRGAVAQTQFDNFHKNSARIIRSSVFGFDDGQKIRDSFMFPQNNLVITSIDIQSVEPVDTKMREELQKSVQLAIEIMTKSQEATARHEATRLDQEARGHLERQKIQDEAEADNVRRKLLPWARRCTIL